MKTKTSTQNFSRFAGELINELISTGRYGTAGTYRNALNNLTTYLRTIGRKDLRISDITPSFIAGYNDSLHSRSMLRNSVSFYNRTLRAIYNKAVRKCRLRDLHPFSNVYTGTDRTSNRAASEEEIARIMAADTGSDPELTLARDLFTFSFLCRGMTFVDMAYLRKREIEGDYLIYRRKKTGTLLKVRLEPEARVIIDRWRDRVKGTVYVFPILGTCEGIDAYRRYRSALTIYNRNLKSLACDAEIRTRLSSYVSRHSWASAAYRGGAAMNLIGESLGHTSERTTRIYVKSINQDSLDEMNRSVVNKIKKFDSSSEVTSGDKRLFISPISRHTPEGFPPEYKKRFGFLDYMRIFAASLALKKSIMHYGEKAPADKIQRLPRQEI